MKSSRRYRSSMRGLGLVSSVLAASCVIPLSTPEGTGGTGSDGGTSHPTTGADGATSSGGLGSMPPPTGTWANATTNLASMASECGNMAALFSKSGEDLLIAGIAQKGLWANHVGDTSWQAIGTASASPVITNRPSSLVFDPSDSNRYWESGLYNGGGVYETKDDGVTFTLLGDSHHCDLVSVDMSDPNRQTLLAGGHEMPNTLTRSTDGGNTWTEVGAALPSGAVCTFPLVIDAQTHLVGCSGYGGGPSGVYRTTDGAKTWTMATASGGASHPLRVSSDPATIYWVSPNGAGMTRSTDSGEHWTDVVGSGVLSTVSPIELPDGRLATIGPSFGKQYVYVSADHGATWNPKTAELPYSDAVGVVYSAGRKAFYIWHLTCGNGNVPVPADAIMSFAFDYQKN
jgi:hypothetical protein